MSLRVNTYFSPLAAGEEPVHEDGGEQADDKVGDEDDADQKPDQGRVSERGEINGGTRDWLAGLAASAAVS